MKRLFLTLVFGLLGLALLVSLGTWQVQRLAWKEGILEEIDSTISGPAVPLPTMIAPSEQRYQPVELNGVIEPGEVHILVSVKLRGAGYRIIAPFVTEDGRRILIDRGFVENEFKDEVRQTGPAAINGNLHWPDDRNPATPENDLTRNIWFARDSGAMAEELETEPLLVVVRSETPPAPGLTPIPVSTEGIPNNHLGYAIQWFGLAAVWAGMTAFLLWRITRRTI